jgi:Protein of unknown function (DUF3618)
MDRANEKSLSDLKRDAEHTRAQLTETVDQLRSRVSETVTDFRERASPDAMKAEVGDYFRTKADALVNRARENPLQTAAIGIGVGYPLLKIARSIPAPILMVGAGLYLLGTSSGQKLSHTVSKKVSAAADGVCDSISSGMDVANKKVHDAQDAAASTFSAARDAVASGIDNAAQKTAGLGSSSLNQLKVGAASLADSAAVSAGGLRQRVGGALAATSDAMSASVASTGSTVRDRAGDAVEFGSQAAEFGTTAGLKLRDQAVEASQKVSSGMSDIIQRNPLLFGGLGLTVGMIIASALPKSDIEKNIMGDASADVRKRANALASQHFDSVKSLASEAIAGIADHVSQEGLTPADLNNATEDFGRRVRKVAESASEAAFGRNEEKTYRSDESVDAI